MRIFVEDVKTLEKDVIKKLCKRLNMSESDAKFSIDIAIKEKEIQKYGNYLIRNGL